MDKLEFFSLSHCSASMGVDNQPCTSPKRQTLDTVSIVHVRKLCKFVKTTDFQVFILHLKVYSLGCD